MESPGEPWRPPDAGDDEDEPMPPWWWVVAALTVLSILLGFWGAHLLGLWPVSSWVLLGQAR